MFEIALPPADEGVGLEPRGPSADAGEAPPTARLGVEVEERPLSVTLALVGPDGYPAVHLAFSLALALLDPDSREAEALLTPLRGGGPVPQLFRAWPPGAAELAHADDGRTEVPWRGDCPGCGGAVAPAPAPRSEFSLPRVAISARQAVGWTYAAELFVLVALGASAALVFATMWASLALGFGIWVGHRWEHPSAAREAGWWRG